MPIIQLAGADDATAHVIFLHGLRGSLATWQVAADSSDTSLQTDYWPAWLADDIPNLAVWAASYPASASRWQGNAIHYVDRAANLLPQIEAEPKLQTGAIALVGYSFGGIVAKEILRTASDRKDPKARSFFERTTRIALIATPNAGSTAASIANVLRIMSAPTEATGGLIARDPNLRGLHAWFRNWAEGRSDAVRSFFETQPSPWVGMVVPPESGDGGVGRSIPLDANHSTIVRVKARSDDLYRILSEFLKDLPSVEQARQVVPIRSPDPSPRTSSTLAGLAAAEEAQPSEISALTQLLTDDVSSTSAGFHRPVEIIDRALKEKLDALIAGRPLPEYRSADRATQLATRLISGDLAHASQDARALALAWCARILSHTEAAQSVGESALRTAMQLSILPEATIARAFIQAAGGDVSSAIATLSELASPEARSAALAIQMRHRSASEAFQWAHQAGITPDNLDQEGQQWFVALLITNNKWVEAAELGANVVDQVPSPSPQLLWLTAIALFSSTAPVELREAALSHVAFHPNTFPLASDAEAIAARRRAEQLFQAFALRARELECPRQAEQALDLALWIRLREPARTAVAQAELQASMNDPDTAIRRVGMALDVGLSLDVAAVENLLDQREALSGGASLATASARFSLALAKPHRDAAAYLKAHRDRLWEYLNPAIVLAAEAQSLVASGQSEQASALIDEFREKLSTQQIEQVSAAIASAGATSHVADAIERYERDGSLPALLGLVEILAAAKEWGSVVTYAEKLFQITSDLQAFELLVRGLEEERLYERQYKLLKSHPDFRTLSLNLKAIWAWTLFRAGLFDECSVTLEQVRLARDEESDRALFVNLAISSGRWEGLGAFVEAEYEARASRSPNEVLRAANIAASIKSARAIDLARAAVGIAGEDANILVGAYCVATAAATEETQETALWLQAAAALSTEGGPVQSISLEELVSRQPDWQQGQDEVVQKLKEGGLPLFIAGHFLRRTVTDMVALQGVANTRERDPTARTLILVRRGVDRPRLGELRSLAIEPTALLLLALAGQLKEVVDSVEKVTIPHATLQQLFEDKQKLPYHQPSLVRQARSIRDALSTGALQRLAVSTEFDDAFARETGPELAVLLVEADARDCEGTAYRVVHSPPIYKIGSLMREVAELGKYAKYVVSCTQVLASLEAIGALNQEDTDRARGLLAMQEPAESYASALPVGTHFYLDSLSLSHLYHAGLLSKLAQTGFTVSVSPDALIQQDKLLNYSNLADEVTEVVEQVRCVLRDGIAAGKVVVADAFRPLSEIEAPTNHPTADIFRLAGGVDAIVCDDRCLGRYLNVNDSGRLVPVTSGLDLLAALADQGRLSSEAFEIARNRLRSANICLLPLSTDELDKYLCRTRLDSDGNLIETAELRAVRENLLSIRASNVLQLPAEGSWLLGHMHAICTTIRSQWRPKVPVEVASRRSEWLLGLCDLRGWAHRLSVQPTDGGMIDLYAQSIAQLLFPLAGAPEAVAAQYWGWIASFLASLEYSNPIALRRLVSLAEEAVRGPLNDQAPEQ